MSHPPAAALRPRSAAILAGSRDADKPRGSRLSARFALLGEDQAGSTMSAEFNIVEAGIADIREALDNGTVTSVELVAACLNRIAHYDRHGIQLNAVPVLNGDMFEEARASDRRRANGQSLGPLDGI